MKLKVGLIAIVFLLGLLVRPLMSSDAPNQLSLISYNTGLAHTFVQYAPERLPLIVEALRERSGDVLCLNEVFEEDDRDVLLEGLSDIYPHAHYVPVEQTRAKPRTCRVRQIFGEGRFINCMRSECSGKDGDEFTSCIINSCGEVLDNLRDENPECATALMAQVGRGTLRSLWSLLNPFRGAGLYVYGGASGVLMLSKYPLENKQLLDFSDVSTLNRRQALKADVVTGAQRHGVACTHLAANLDGTVPYTGPFADWEAENRAQTQELLKAFESYENPTYLIGDFNFGPSLPELDIHGVFEPTYYDTLALGYESPAVTLNPSCTFCSDNPLVNEGNDPKDYLNRLIDHVLIRNAYGVSSEVIFKQKVHVNTDDGRVQTRLSDHYGVEVTVEW